MVVKPLIIVSSTREKANTMNAIETEVLNLVTTAAIEKIAQSRKLTTGVVMTAIQNGHTGICVDFRTLTLLGWEVAKAEINPK